MTYSRSPLTEALVEIRTDGSENFAFDSLSEFDSILSGDYAKPEIRYTAQGKFVLKETPTATIEHRPSSRMYRNGDEKLIFQVMTNGIVLSRLPPYQSWSVFFPELQRLWAVYKSVVHPKKVVRLAARYINQIEISASKIELEEYLNIFPSVVMGSPERLKEIVNFTMNVHLRQIDIGGIMIVNQGILPSSGPDTISILLDYDLFIHDLALENDDIIWVKLEQIRQRKNEYFEATITDKLREIIR